MLTVITPAVDRSLLTLDEIKTALGVTGSSEDAALSALGLRISDLIARECGVPSDGIRVPTLLVETLQDTFRLTSPQCELMLSRRPAIEIVSVSINGDVVAAENFEVDAWAGYLRHVADDELKDWPEGKIVVQYRGGWSADQLKTAALMVLREIVSAEARDPLVKAESVEGVGSTTYWTGGLGPTNGAALSSQAVAALDPFRYWAFA